MYEYIVLLNSIIKLQSMNKDFIKSIGIKDNSRKDADMSYLNDIDGLKDTFDSDFDSWSNFDSLESISVQQWIFARALDVYRGRKIDIKCDCCEYNLSISNDFDNIEREKCYGKKSVYMIKKVLDEIVLAKSIRERDGTYSA